MTPVARIMAMCTTFGALVGGGMAFVISSGLFWGGLIGGALSGAAIGAVCVMLSEGDRKE